MAKRPSSTTRASVARISPRFVPDEGKFAESAAQDWSVPRGQAVDRLRESVDVPVVLVTAPAGYGKTALIRQWREEDDRPFAWLSLDASDNNAESLVGYLTHALQRIDESDPVADALQDSHADVTAVALPRLGRWLWQRRSPFVLVLDDAGVVTSQAALDVLTVVADHMPTGSQLVIVSRQAPKLAWMQLRASRRLLELGPDDLRLSEAEAEVLLGSIGLGFGADEAAELLGWTEGWPAGLYLVAMARHRLMRSGAGADPAAESAAVAAFFEEEVCLGLSPAQRSFLRRSSILDQLSASKCDAVLAADDSDHMLRTLAEANAFVAPVDTTGAWFRVHPMFREVLRRELHRREPGLERELHVRASRWWGEHDGAEQGIRHAIAAGEPHLAARLIWAQAEPQLAAGRPETLRRWLSSFTEREILGEAEMALTAAWCAITDGRAADELLTAAEQGDYEADQPGTAEARAAATVLLRAALSRRGVVQMGADARFSHRLQRPSDPWWGFSQYLEAVSAHLSGRREVAQSLLQQTVQLAADVGAEGPRVLACSQLAVMAIERHDWVNAIELADTIISTVADLGLESVPFMAPAFAVVALPLAKAGRLDEARAQARQSTRSIALMTYLPPWASVQARYLLARARLILGDPAAARVLLSDAQTVLPLVSDATVLGEQLDLVWKQIEKLPLGLESGASTLTTAELRVLHLLPTHLSFEQIGGRLFISRNTVKTEAIAAYRKLGVSSRSEAVEQARALGML